MPPSKLGICESNEEDRRPRIDSSLLALNGDDASTVAQVDSDEETLGSCGGSVWHRRLSQDSLDNNRVPKRLSPSDCDDRRWQGSADPRDSINSGSTPSKPLPKPGAIFRKKYQPNHRCPSLNQALTSIVRAPRYPPSIPSQAGGGRKSYRKLLSRLKDLEVRSGRDLKGIFGSDRSLGTKDTKGTVNTSSRSLDSRSPPSTATIGSRAPKVEDSGGLEGIFSSDRSLCTRSTADSSFRSLNSCCLPSAATEGNGTPLVVRFRPNMEVYIFRA